MALAVVLFFCPLAIATVHPWAVSVAAGLAGIAFVLTVWAVRRSGEPFLVPAPGTALVVVTAFIGLQLVPLPPTLLGLLAPKTRDTFELVLAPLGLYPAWRPLSLDPPATGRELAKGVTYLAVFLSAVQIVRSRRAKARIVAALGVTGVVVALIGFGHALWGATTLFGVFEYKQATPPFLTTFGNPNHLSSFLSLAATALLAKVLGERDRKIATLWGFGYLAAGVGVLLSLSRGGIVAFVTAQIMLGIAVWLVRRSEREGVALEPRAFVIPMAVLVVLAVSAYLALDALADELASTDSLDKIRSSKIGMWPSFLPLIGDHWLAGVGRGAFESAFQRFQDPLWSPATFTHAENIVAQWLTDVGLPVGLLFLGSCGWTLVTALRRGASDIDRLACVFGLGAVALHDFVDFGLELGGLAVPATVALAVACSKRERAPSLRLRTVAVAVPLAVALGVLGLLKARHSLSADGEALAAKIATEKADTVATLAVQMAERHPGDYFAHLAVARAYAVERPLRADKVIGFANRAMYLNSTLSLPHRLAALALRAIGHAAQARIEYALAFELHDTTVVPEIARVFKTPEEMADALPDRADALAALADELIQERRLDLAGAIARRSVERHGEQVIALQRLARIEAARGQFDEELKIGERLSAVAPERTLGVHVRVEALRGQGNLEGALRLVEGEGLKRFPLDTGIIFAVSRLRLERGDTKGCREVLDRLPADLDVNPRLEAVSLAAAAAEKEGQGTKALALMRQAVSLSGDSADWRWHFALMLERLGRLDEAGNEAAAVVEKAPRLRDEAEKLRARVAARARELEEVRRWKDVAGDEGRSIP